MELIKFWTPAVDDLRLKELAKYLMTKPYYLSDEYRNYDVIWQMIFDLFFNPNQNHVWLELGDFQGILGWVNIVPGWKADVFFKIWDKSIWKPSLAKSLKQEINNIVKLFDLRRLSLETGHEPSIKLAKMFGFVVEGRLVEAYSWKGKIGTKFLMRYHRKKKKEK